MTQIERQTIIDVITSSLNELDENGLRRVFNCLQVELREE